MERRDRIGASVHGVDKVIERLPEPGVTVLWKSELGWQDEGHEAAQHVGDDEPSRQRPELGFVELEWRQQEQREHGKVGDDHGRPERQRQLEADVKAQPVAEQAGAYVAADIDRKERER